MLKIEIHEYASQEFDEAIDCYEFQAEDLGLRFKNTVIQQIKKLQNHPSWFLKEEENIYKAYIPKFPYKILFSFDNEKIIIWAIAHLHRKPQYW
jgi:plasmid stabilization system protein ParE